MASITYQITITSDGKPAVTVTSDDPQATRDAIPWLAQTYATLLKDVKAVRQSGTTVVKAQQAEEPPICATHQVPMARVQGRKAPFWSCHEKMPDGSWCSHRPTVTS